MECSDDPAGICNLPFSTSSRFLPSQKKNASRLNNSPCPPPVDLEKCNHQRFWRSAACNLIKYFACFKPVQARSSQIDKVTVNRDMSGEEHTEKLKAAIAYCKDSYRT